LAGNGKMRRAREHGRDMSGIDDKSYTSNQPYAGNASNTGNTGNTSLTTGP
jgi:hypothetical protein